jgi:hypothetical protein
MSPTLAGVALAVTVGAVIAASSREARAALIGLVVALALGPFLTEPLPGTAVLGARVITGILVVYLLRAASAGGEVPGQPSRIGWPSGALMAVAAAFAGIAVARSLADLQPGGPPPGAEAGLLQLLTPAALALAAGLASFVVGLGPAFLGQHALRATIGLLLVVQGVVLARTGLAGPPGELEQLGINGLMLAVGVGGALLAILERRALAEPVGPDATTGAHPAQR